jgi:deoxyhypusine synthase
MRQKKVKLGDYFIINEELEQTPATITEYLYKVVRKRGDEYYILELDPSAYKPNLGWVPAALIKEVGRKVSLKIVAVLYGGGG